MTEEPNARWRETAQRRHDPERGDELTSAIVDAIAEADGIEPTAVKSPKLYDVVDVASIERALFDPQTTTGSDGTGSVEFRYDIYRITVDGDGWVRVYESAKTDL